MSSNSLNLKNINPTQNQFDEINSLINTINGNISDLEEELTSEMNNVNTLLNLKANSVDVNNSIIGINAHNPWVPDAVLCAQLHLFFLFFVPQFFPAVLGGPENYFLASHRCRGRHTPREAGPTAKPLLCHRRDKRTRGKRGIAARESVCPPRPSGGGKGDVEGGKEEGGEKVRRTKSRGGRTGRRWARGAKPPCLAPRPRCPAAV